MPEDATEPDDAAEPEDLDAVAERLESALARIVRRLDAPGTGTPSKVTAEIAARLDTLIERLRDVLGDAGDEPASQSASRPASHGREGG